MNPDRLAPGNLGRLGDGAVVHLPVQAMARLVRDPELIDGPIEPLMEAALPVVDASADFETVTRMLVGGQSAVLVRGDGKPDGIITRHDVVRYLTGFGP